MEAKRIPAWERLSHAYIAASPNEAARSDEAMTLAAALMCESDGEARPCGHCAACRKTFAGIHPDIITVSPGLDSQGRKRREMLVDTVRSIAAGAVVVPNEGRRKVYIIEDADTMNTQAQNALLKLLEEPPESVAFILCAANPALLLPTVRSRCELIRINSDAAEGDEAAADARALLSRLLPSPRRTCWPGAARTRAWIPAAAPPCSAPRGRRWRRAPRYRRREHTAGGLRLSGRAAGPLLRIPAPERGRAQRNGAHRR